MSGRPALHLLRIAPAAALVTGLCLVLLLATGPDAARVQPHGAPGPTIGSPRPALAFEPNAGRFGDDLRFLARRGGYALGLMRDGSTVLASGRARVQTKLVGASPNPVVRAESRLPGVVNSYVGNDKRRWRTGLPTFGAVRYEQVYPGIDLLFHGRQGRLEYDYVVAPGADPSRVVQAISGTRPPKLSGGDLVIPTAAGALRQRHPVAYQQIGGARVRVPAAFDLDGRRVHFRVGRYDERRPLVIDPQLLFTTYVGGTHTDSASEAEQVQTNGDGYLIVGGITTSASFHGSNQNADGAFVTNDVWLSKMTTDGSKILVTTFIGGTGQDSLSGMTTGGGRVFVTGGTAGGMPIDASLVTPADPDYNAGDTWIGRINPTDLTPEVVTYFEGPTGAGIAYTNFTVVVAGSTSTSGLAAGTGFDTTPSGTDAFAASFNFSLTVEKWATYLGGSAEDIPRAVTTDSNSNVILAGYSAGPSDFPVTVGSGSGAFNEGFLSRLSPTGAALTFSRLYGGADYDIVNSVWVTDSASDANDGVALLGGETTSPSLPGIGGPTPPAGFNGFIVQVSLVDGSTQGGAFLGGTGNTEAVTDVGVDGFGEAYALGVTNSTDFPTVNPVQSQNAGGNDVFLVKRFGSQTIFSTYLGGSGSESPGDLVIDPARPNEAHVPGALRAYVVGGTTSTNLGATALYSEDAPDVVQPANAGGGDGFVARIQPLSAKITGGPAAGSTVASSTANFALGPALEAGAFFNCSLDGAAFDACSATPSFPSLADGPHTLRARYHDAAALTDGTVASRTWTVDTTPPASFSLQSPADSAIVVATPAFSWNETTDALSAPVTYELRVDGAPRGEDPACDGGVCSVTLTSALADGAHTWQIRAVDAVGNVRSSATRTIVVDAAGPSAAGATKPAEGAELATDKPELGWSAATDAGSGLAEYDIELDGRVLGLHLSPSTLSYTPDALAEGTHDWRVVATDAFGNSTSSAVAKFRVDLTPPGAQLSASPNPMLAGRTVTLDASASNDPAGGRIVRFEWDLDGDGTFETDGGTKPTITKAFNATGTYILAVRVTDPVGQTRVAATTLIVTTPPVPVGQLGVTINNGAQYTRTPDVTLNLKFPTATTQLLTSNDGGFLAPTTFAPKQEIAWKLDSSGPERLPKTVYVRFLLSGIVSETYTDDIILDETPPVVEQAAVTPAASGAARAAKLQSFTVKVKASDSNSGVDAVQITAKKSKPGRFLKYKTKLEVKAPTRKLYVRARDRAGNLSAWKKAR